MLTNLKCGNRRYKKWLPNESHIIIKTSVFTTLPLKN